MRSSRWLPVAGWCLATATSIVLSSVALLPVLNAARAEPGAALPDLEQLPPAPVPAASSLPSPAARPSSAASSAVPPSPSASPSPSRPARTASTSPTPDRKPSTTTPTTMPPTSTEDGWTVTQGDGGKTYVRSFRVDGGVAVIKATNGTVSVVTATPAEGYSVQQTQETPDNLAVYFLEHNHHFIIHVTWATNAPYAQVSEIGS